jgi:guanylate kinase
LILVISGPGGVGKGTLVERLLQLEPGLRLSKSWTTRERRPNEPPDAYVFVDEAAFKERVDAGGFLEWTRFPGTGALMGTPAFDPDETGDVLLEIDLDGARQVKEKFPQAVVVFVAPPSLDAQEERLRRRGDDEASIARRLEVGRAEMELGPRIADHVVVNDDLDRAAGELAGIIAARREGR